MERVIVFDTTLRDGEQSAGVSLTVDEKLSIAKQLEKLGVDVIEAGYPISSVGDYNAVKRIAEEIRKPSICALARTIIGEGMDIHRAYEAVKDAYNPRIHTFISTSPVHMKHKLGKNEDDVLRITAESIAYAKQLLGARGTVEFSAEDATRSEPEFLYKVIGTAIDSGADVINIPDTVGYVQPKEYAALVSSIQRNVKGIDNCVLSAHCHNDLGMAVANSLESLNAGVKQIECTINGIGERAGNAALEEIVAALRTRHDYFGFETGINAAQIGKTSKLVSRAVGMPVQPNKAIVGENAFAHSSGIHQDGVLKNRTTYEIMKPEDYGWTGEQIVISSKSGRRGIRNILDNLGYKLDGTQIDETCRLVKELGNKKKKIFTDDLILIVEDEVITPRQKYSIVKFEVESGVQVEGTNPYSFASVVITDGRNFYGREASSKNGPVNSLFKAIGKAVNVEPRLMNYKIESASPGKSSVGEVTLRIRYNGKEYLGRRASTNILEASANAYLSAINKCFSHQ